MELAQRGDVLREAGRDAKRYERAAVAASLASVLVFCFWVLRTALDPAKWPWHASGNVVLVVLAVWLTLAIAGITMSVAGRSLFHCRRRWLTIAITLGVVSLVALPVASAGSLLYVLGPHHPSDGKLLSNFAQHEAQFEQVISDFRSHVRVRDARLVSLGIEVDGVERDSGGLVLLSVSTWGLVPSGSSKGYAYSKHPLRPVTDGQIEDYRGDMPNEIVYRHIKGPWYLFFEVW
jgi:hypothetical protein